MCFGGLISLLGPCAHVVSIFYKHFIPTGFHAVRNPLRAWRFVKPLHRPSTKDGRRLDSLRYRRHFSDPDNAITQLYNVAVFKLLYRNELSKLAPKDEGPIPASNCQ